MRKFRVKFDYLNAENEKRWTTFWEVFKHDHIWEVDRREKKSNSVFNVLYKNELLCFRQFEY